MSRCLCPPTYDSMNFDEMFLKLDAAVPVAATICCGLQI